MDYSPQKTSIAIAVVAVLSLYGIARAAFKTPAETRYILTTVQKGTIVSSITGSGQVAASGQIDLQPKVSGEITSIHVKNGQKITKGTLIASIDSRDAHIALENAQIAVDKLTTTDPLTVIQKQNAVASATQNLAETYDSAWNETTKTLLDLPAVIDSLNTLYASNGYLSYGNTALLSTRDREPVDQAQASIEVAKQAIAAANKNFTLLSRLPDPSTIGSSLPEVYNATVTTVKAIKDAQNAVDYVATRLNQSDSSKVSAVRTTIGSLITTANSHASNLLASKNAITQDKSTITENTQSLTDTTNGPDALDLRSAQLDLEQKQNAYEDYFLRAPFDGTIENLTAQVGLTAGATSLGTLSTDKKIATITLNEVDVAKIAVGQKVTLTFDAIDGLTISGEVAEIDAVGTVTQGVVTYSVKIGFDTQDDRIKSGMSVTAAIITDSKADVLVVPSSAVKSGTNGSYVMVLDDASAPVFGTQGVTSTTAPRQVPVETGISDDTRTEIISGLTESEQIVSKVVSPSTATTKPTTTPSLLGGGARGFGR